MTNPTITPDTTVCRVDEVLASSLGDETVMMNMDQGQYYGLNVTGTWLWDVLVEPMAVRDLCDQLAAEFTVSPHQCERDVSTFVEDLVARGLVQVVSDAEV
jgi:hypothetical protein